MHARAQKHQVWCTKSNAAHSTASIFIKLRHSTQKKTARKSKDRTKARQAFLLKLSMLPKPAAHICTDGSCFRSEHIAGSGVFIIRPSATNAYLSYPPGDVSNNVAELHAILQALHHLLDLCTRPPCATIPAAYLFVDNTVRNTKPHMPRHVDIINIYI